MRSYRRKAKIVFYVILVITPPDRHRRRQPLPVLALFAGPLRAVIAAIAAGIVAAWPVIRAIWWWDHPKPSRQPDFGWVDSPAHPWPPAFVYHGIPCPSSSRPHPASTRPPGAWSPGTASGPVSEFIITNRTGSLPLILWARPTPVGERVWIWLRPGLSLDDLQNRLDKIAVACWASTALAETASRSNAAFIRLDIKRRDVLTGTITSPLLGHDQARRPRLRAGHYRDPDRAGPVPGPRQRGRHYPSGPAERPDAPRWPDRPSSPAPAASDGSDINDWI